MELQPGMVLEALSTGAAAQQPATGVETLVEAQDLPETAGAVTTPELTETAPDATVQAEATATRLAPLVGAGDQGSRSWRELVAAAIALPTTISLLAITKWQNRQPGALQAFLEHAGPLAKIVAKTGHMLEQVGGLQNAVRIAQVGKAAVSLVLQARGLAAPISHDLSSTLSAVDQALATVHLPGEHEPQKPNVPTGNGVVLTADVTSLDTYHAPANLSVAEVGGSHVSAVLGVAEAAGSHPLPDGGSGANSGLIPDSVLDKLTGDDRKFALDTPHSGPLGHYEPGTGKGTIWGEVDTRLNHLGYSNLTTDEKRDIVDKVLKGIPDPKHPGENLTWQTARNLPDNWNDDAHMPNNGSLIVIASQVTAARNHNHLPTMPGAGSPAALHIASALHEAGNSDSQIDTSGAQNGSGTATNGGNNTDGHPPKGAGAQATAPTPQPTPTAGHPSPANTEPSTPASHQPSQAASAQPSHPGSSPSHPHPTTDASPSAAPNLAPPHTDTSDLYYGANPWLVWGATAAAGAAATGAILYARHNGVRAPRRPAPDTSEQNIDPRDIALLRRHAAARAEADLAARKSHEHHPSAATNDEDPDDDILPSPARPEPVTPPRRGVLHTLGDLAGSATDTVKHFANERRRGQTVVGLGDVVGTRRRRPDLSEGVSPMPSTATDGRDPAVAPAPAPAPADYRTRVPEAGYRDPLLEQASLAANPAGSDAHAAATSEKAVEGVVVEGTGTTASETTPPEARPRRRRATIIDQVN